MKKSILLLSVGLGLLATKESFAAICADDGTCFIRSYVPLASGEWLHFYNQKTQNLIATRGDLDWKNKVIVHPEAFPIDIIRNTTKANPPPYKKEDVEYTISEPHCYDLQAFVPHYWTTRLACNVGQELPQKSPAPKSSPQPVPHK